MLQLSSGFRCCCCLCMIDEAEFEFNMTPRYLMQLFATPSTVMIMSLYFLVVVNVMASGLWIASSRHTVVNQAFIPSRAYTSFAFATKATSSAKARNETSSGSLIFIKPPYSMLYSVGPISDCTTHIGFGFGWLNSNAAR